MSARPEAQAVPNGTNLSESFSWLPGFDTPGNGNTQNGAMSPAWQLPIQNQTSHSISFPYPNTPTVAPPHQQPLSEVNNLHPLEFASSSGNNGNALNLGFATVDDWFGSSAANQGEQPDDSNNPFGGLDLQDFWMKVGPGEAQGGFPFR
jgi:hypothetical protein